MTDKEPWFPGFIGDDDPPKTETPPAPPSAPASAPAAAPVPVKPAPAKPAAVKPAPAPAPAPVPAPASAPPAASPTAAEEDEDRDIKPGSRKDLWKCPHCGAGNKPERDTCRTCGKKPTEPVIRLWYQNPLIRAGIMAAIGLIAVLVVWLMRVDVSVRPPMLGSVDSKPRIGSAATGSIELGGTLSIEIDSQFGICGRVAALGNGPGGTQLIALALGPAARDEKPAVSTSGSSFTIDGGVVLACSGDHLPPLKVGRILSLRGATGRIMKEGQFAKEGEGLIAVHVSEAKVEAE